MDEQKKHFVVLEHPLYIQDIHQRHTRLPCCLLLIHSASDHMLELDLDSTADHHVDRHLYGMGVVESTLLTHGRLTCTCFDSYDNLHE